MNDEILVDSVIVSVDFSHGKDSGFLLVGKNKINKPIEIINAFQGQEAWDLYKKLITKNNA